jgi:DNA-binding LacI/PurR family transcriptional regulator
LLDLGHERIGYISGPTTTSNFLERRVGFETTLNQFGIKISSEYLHVIDQSSSDVEKVTWKLMNLPQPPTAIIGANDSIALKIMDAIISYGLKVPDDVSIAGMDTIQISAHNSIQLTSIGHQSFDIGEIAIEKLIDLIERKVTSPQQLELFPELIIRRTTSRIQKKVNRRSR